MSRKDAPNVIGLTGYKGSGKSAVAGILVEAFGFIRVGFADVLKWAVQDIYNLSDAQVYGDLKEVPDERYHLTPRYIMQRFGTEVCRSVHPHTWILALKRNMDNMPGQRFVIDDLRFENEAKAVREWGGVIWRVHRPGTQPDGHASETGIAGDYTLWNVGNLDDLKTRVFWRFECGYTHRT